MAQGGDVELVQHLLHPLAHQGLGQVVVLHGEGQFVLHRVHHELGLRVLEDESHQAAHAPGRLGHRVVACHPNPSLEDPAVEMGHQSVQAAQQGGLAGPRSSDDQQELPFFQAEGEISQHGGFAVGIAIGHVSQLDHSLIFPFLGAVRAGAAGAAEASPSRGLKVGGVKLG